METKFLKIVEGRFLTKEAMEIVQHILQNLHTCSITVENGIVSNDESEGKLWVLHGEIF